jgi:predicted SprT family Zn-dependent metalloprotease
MRSLLRQLEFLVVGQALRLPNVVAAPLRRGDPSRIGGYAATERGGYSGRDHALEEKSRTLLRQLGAAKLAREICVEWNPRMKSAAGRADFRAKLISLNPRLTDHGVRAGLAVDEIDRTLRHELAHLLAQSRVGRRRIAPHGPEWREACRDLNIADEARCHNLPFASKSFAPRFVYRCWNCRQEFPRVCRIRRVIACLACCRKHNRGDFDPRFRLKLTTTL